MRTAICLLLAALAACSAAPVRREPVAAHDAADALYVRVKEAVARIDAALAALQGTDSEAARAEHAAARAELVALGDACVAAPGCDPRRVIAAQDGVLLRQSQLFAGRSDDPAAAGDAAVVDGEEASPLLQQVPAAGRTVALLNGQDLARIIALNEPLKAALEEWLTWMRPQLLDTWENYQFMRHRMFPHYERRGLPEALLFGILAKESNGKVHAVSRAGAAGPLQFMPATGARFGLNRGGAFDLRFDPGESARASAEYLQERFAELNGNLALALAAYNGGEGRVARLSGRGTRDFWSPAVFGALPPETREYVPMVLAAAWLFLHPERYNLSFPEVDTRAAQIVLAEPTSINEIAVCLGQRGNPRGWFRHLRNLNPRWDPTERLPAGTTLALPGAAETSWRDHCERGEMLAMSRELHDARPPVAPPVPGARAGNYVVRQGDSLHRIARHRGCNVATLARENAVQGPKYLIRPGQRLRLVGCSRA